MLANFQSRKWTAAEIDRMVEAGILGEDDPYELIEGELVEMSPQGPIHMVIKDRLHRLLARAYEPALFVRDQGSLACGATSMPEPDLCVATIESLERHPRGDETVLVVEIAYTSQAIDRHKALVYARAGAPEFWLLDLRERRIEAHTHPSENGYRLVTIVDESLELELPGLKQRWRLEDVLR